MTAASTLAENKEVNIISIILFAESSSATLVLRDHNMKPCG